MGVYSTSGRRLLFLIQDTRVGTLPPLVPELKPQLRGFRSEYQTRGYLTATEEHEEGNDLQMPK